MSIASKRVISPSQVLHVLENISNKILKEKKIQHFLVLPSDLEVQKFRSKVKHIQNWARDLKQPLNDSSLYPEHIAFYFTEISLLGQELLAFKDWLSVPFWAIFRIFVTQFLKNGKPDREKISYFSKSVWVLPVYQKLSKSESVGCHARFGLRKNDPDDNYIEGGINRKNIF